MSWSLSEAAATDERWQRLLSEHPHLVFHEPVWAAVLQKGINGQPVCLLLELDGVCRGGMVGFFYRVIGIRLAYFNLPYGGVVGQAPPPEVLARLLHEWALAQGVSRVRLNASPEVGDPILEASIEMMQSLEKYFTVIPLTTNVLSFQGGDHKSIYANFKKRVRRDVLKAEKSGVSILEVQDTKGIEVFYGLYIESMQRNRTVAKYSLAFVQAVASQLLAEGRASLLLAMRRGVAIAGMLLVDSETSTHYLMAGSRSDGLRYCPNDLLLNHAIGRAAERGCRSFDFLPSGENNLGLEKFKAKWNALAVEVPVYELVVRPVMIQLFYGMYAAAQSWPGRWLVKTFRQYRRAVHGRGR